MRVRHDPDVGDERVPLVSITDTAPGVVREYISDRTAHRQRVRPGPDLIVVSAVLVGVEHGDLVVEGSGSLNTLT